MGEALTAAKLRDCTGPWDAPHAVPIRALLVPTLRNRQMLQARLIRKHRDGRLRSGQRRCVAVWRYNVE